MTIHIAVIGAPCTGKTTLINALKEKGYFTINEASREMIEKQKKLGGTLLPWMDRDAFQKEMLKIQIKKREACQEKDLVFSDTSISCGIAYYLADELEAPKELWDATKKYPYELVFILDFPQIYLNDSVRKETMEKSEKVQKKIKEVNQKLGYKIIEVPAVSVQERVEIIEEAIKKEFPGLFARH